MCDWMHCNQCSLRYTPIVKLFLSECGHLFCERCVQKIKDSKCTICGKVTTTIELSKEMDFSIQPFFSSFDSVLRKALEIYIFQMQHSARLFNVISQKYAYAKRECISCHNKNKSLARENKMLKDMLMSASKKQLPHPFQTSTPAFTADNSRPDNISMISSDRCTPSFRLAPGYAQRVTCASNRYAKWPNHRSNIFGSGFSKGPSPAHVMPNRNTVPVHGPPGTTKSMDELRKARKRT